MSYNIHFSASCFLDDLPYTHSQLSAAFGYRCRRFLIAKIYCCSVFRQLTGYPAPIIKESVVSEEYSMYHQQRIFSLAYLLMVPGLIQGQLLPFKGHFLGHGFYYHDERRHIGYRYHPYQRTYDAYLYPQLYGRAIDQYDPCPEDDELYDRNSHDCCQM